jgi:hypothetical protein
MGSGHADVELDRENVVWYCAALARSIWTVQITLMHAEAPRSACIFSKQCPYDGWRKRSGVLGKATYCASTQTCGRGGMILNVRLYVLVCAPVFTSTCLAWPTRTRRRRAMD